jgi:hypothetical protein
MRLGCPTLKSDLTELTVCLQQEDYIIILKNCRAVFRPEPGRTAYPFPKYLIKRTSKRRRGGLLHISSPYLTPRLTHLSIWEQRVRLLVFICPILTVDRPIPTSFKPPSMGSLSQRTTLKKAGRETNL